MSASDYVTFSDLRVVAYCPRSLYYRRRSDDVSPPSIVDEIRAIAHRYEHHLSAGDRPALREEPLEIDPLTWRRRLERARDRLGPDWDRLCSPAARDVLATGRDCRGVVHKVLSDPPEPSIVSPARPPDAGVWDGHAVQAVAAAKALAWERERPVGRAWVEYPAHGAVRSVTLTTRRLARYRRALRTVRHLDGPPPRLANRSKCSACAYAEECGVRTRTLRSLLGLD